jgi:putative redox protein
MIIDCESETPNGWPQVLHVGKHVLRADVDEKTGSTDSAPGPHEYFDASLATCKALTAIWYAKRNGIPLERVETHVERDASAEQKGVYRLSVRLGFHGAALTEAQKQKLYDVVGRCPVHKLMTTTEIVIETAPLGG